MAVLARAGVILFGTLALLWACAVFPVFLQQQKPIGLAAAIERGESHALTTMLAQTNTAVQPDFGFCYTPAVRARMMILAKVMEDPAVVENRTLQDAAWSRLHAATRSLLACSPSDSLAWLILFWLNVTRNGYSAEYGRYLQLSYDTSPNEAAVSFWRNKLVLGLNDRLPSRFVDAAIPEFVRLVNTERLYPEMGDIFQQAPPALQLRLALALKTAEPRPRAVFANMLRERGVRSTAIPDTGSAPDRPWN